MYWTVPMLPLLDERVGIAFTARESITADSDGFLRVLTHLAQHPAQAAELDRVPFFVDSLCELTSLGYLDLGYTVGVATDGLLSLFHEHVVRLMILFGRDASAVVPFEIWRRRSRLLAERCGWESDLGLLDIVAGELMLYLRTLYMPMFAAVAQLARTLALADQHSELHRWFQYEDRQCRMPPVEQQPYPPSPEKAIAEIGADIDVRFDRVFDAMGIRLINLEQCVANSPAPASTLNAPEGRREFS
jgi:hypothetical protein